MDNTNQILDDLYSLEQQIASDLSQLEDKIDELLAVREELIAKTAENDQKKAKKLQKLFDANYPFIDLCIYESLNTYRKIQKKHILTI